MTDKQRIEALREALRKTITEWGAAVWHGTGHGTVGRLREINSVAMRALRDDDHAEIAGGEDDRLIPSDPTSPLEFRPDED